MRVSGFGTGSCFPYQGSPETAIWFTDGQADRLFVDMSHMTNGGRGCDVAATGIREADDDAIQAAVRLLEAGDVVGIPTETVYGLGADATNGLACAKIFDVKGRPSFNPLIAHCSSIDMALEHGVFSADAERLARAFWPGPLTLVVQQATDSGISDLVTTGLPTIALRVPDAPIMRRLVDSLGRPIAAPSANRSGHVSATTARAVAEDLGDAVPLVLDGGASPVGVESTIIDVSGIEPTLLRPGGLDRAEIEAVVGNHVAMVRMHGGETTHRTGNAERPLCPVLPGSPQCRSGETRRRADPVRSSDCGGGANKRTFREPQSFRRSPRSRGPAVQHAARPGCSGRHGIAVAPIPETGLGEAINDRLRRASLGRVR